MVTALDHVKNSLGVAEDYDVFDKEIWGHVSSSLSELNQIWAEIGREHYNPGIEIDLWLPRLEGRDQAIEYVCRKTRLRFDPPQNAFLVNEIRKDLEETAWRLEVSGSRHDEFGRDKWKK